MTRPTTTPAIIDEWAQRPLDFDPGTEWQYSNTGYVLAGAVVEKVSGEPCSGFSAGTCSAAAYGSRVCRQNPPPGERCRQRRRPYTRHGLGPVVPAPKEGPGWLFGAAGLAMQPSDLASWDISLIDRSLLEAESYRQEFEPVVLANGRAQEYALGLAVQTVHGRLRIGHAGAGSGFLADNRIWPGDKRRHRGLDQQ